MEKFKILLFFPIIVATEVLLEPRNSSVLLGSEANFNCSLKEDWVVMTWLFNGNVILTVSKEYGVLSNTARFKALNYTTNENYKWQFTIINVTRNDSGEITCDVQSIQSTRAHLSVQESGTISIIGGNLTVKHFDQAVFVCVATGWFPDPQVSWRIDDIMADPEYYNTTVDAAGTQFNSYSTLSISAVDSAQIQCLAKVSALFTPQTSTVFLKVDKTEDNLQPDRTLLIALTVTISLAALVVLLIIGIILYCKKKTAKKARSQKQTTEETHGQANLGYIDDGYTNDHSSSVAAESHQIPDMCQRGSSQQNYLKAHEGMDKKKLRHVTIV